MLIELVLLALGLIIGAVTVALCTRSISTPLVSLQVALDKVRAGGGTDIPSLERQDEIGGLARGLAEFCRESVDATRIKLALDCADASVMVADADHNIVYVNRKLLDMFRSIETDLKRDLPAFNVDTLVGTNIDGFDKNPAHQRGILDQLSGAQKAEIQVGGRDLAFIASPVVGARGERLGTVVEWRDLTEEIVLRGVIEDVVVAASAGNFSKRVNATGMQGTASNLAHGINQLVELVENATKDLAQMLAWLMVTSQDELSRATGERSVS